jgi:hypothetical protein
VARIGAGIDKDECKRSRYVARDATGLDVVA